MRIASMAAAVGVLAFLSACGGGGGSSDAGAPTKIVVSLIATGEIRSLVPIASKLQVITTQAAWDSVRARLPEPVPAQYEAPDFAQVSMVYVEGSGDNDPFSVIRVLDALRQDSGASLVTVEQCGGSQAAPRSHIPFAIYFAPRFAGATVFSSTFASRPDCQATKSLPVTRVAGRADFAATAANTFNRSTIIRTQAQLNVLIAELPPNSIPAAYLAPDFTQVNLIAAVGRGDIHTPGHVGILALLEERDQSHDLLVEYCAPPAGSLSHHLPFTPFALYAVAPITGPVRVAMLEHAPGAGTCVTGPAPPTPPGEMLAFTLATAGTAYDNGESATTDGLRIIRSAAELAQLVSLRYFSPIPELANVDYTQNSVLFVEGPLDDVLGSVVRVMEVRRMSATLDQVTAERCASAPPTAPVFRPYAFYVVPNLAGSTSMRWTESASNCATVVVVPATRVAVGDFLAGNGLPQPPFFGSKAIRTQAELDALLPSFPPGAVPAAFRTPDFSQVTLLFVQPFGDWDESSYVRVFRVYGNPDGSHDVMAEYCGNSIVGIPFHNAYALYAVPRFTGAARFSIVGHEPGSCIHAR